jgi:hypothetical protein
VTNGSARHSALLRLAAAGGRSDRLRIALTALGSSATTILLLTAASVALISAGDGPYRLGVLDQPGLRPGVIIALLVSCVPLVIFLGLCTRVGAPARDRRLAMIRMAGATPAESTRIAAYETGIAAGLGSLAGTAAFLIGRVVFDRTTVGRFTVTMADGSTRTETGATLLLPTDVDVPWWVIVVVAAAVAVGATLASTVALRNVRISPFGLTRRVPTNPPTTTAAVLFAVGAGGLIGLGVVSRVATGRLPVLVVLAFALFSICVAGLLMGSASLSVGVGRFLAPRTSRPDVLIASRRMIDAPFTASRASASVLLAVLIGGAILGTRANFLASQDPADTFYADTFDLLDIVLGVAIVLSAANLLITTSEAIVDRRRTLSALVAGGTPRIVLARAAVLESLVPLVPAVVVASAAGVLASRSTFGTTVERPATFEASGDSQWITVGVPVPWTQLVLLGGSAIASSLMATTISLVFLRASTRPSEMRTAA